MKAEMNVTEMNKRREARLRKARRRRRMQRIRLASRTVLVAVLLTILGWLLWDGGILKLPVGSLFDWKTKEEAKTAQVYQNESGYPQKLLEALEKNPELEEFVKGYLTWDGSVSGELSSEELSQDFPLLMQYDSRWGYAAYGDDNIALSGCAPTCLSMVIIGLTHNTEASPNAVADYAMEKGYYQMGVGTMWSLMTEGCLDFGVTGREISLDQNVMFKHLEAGEPIICSMRPGDFTTSGHFIVLTGVEDGKIRVNDPFSRERSSKLWEYDTLQYQIKNLWAFS